MSESAFDPHHQETDLSSKIVVGLERLSNAFRALLWAHAKEIGLSPIQIQILIFSAYHPSNLCNVSHLAAEFNLTKPTISDAIRVLLKKELITKQRSDSDLRAYSIALSPKGQQVVKDTENFSSPIQGLVSDLEPVTQDHLFASIAQMISGLNKAGILTVQRTCLSCAFFTNRQGQHHCKLIKKDLRDRELRLDCKEHEQKSA